MAVQESRQNLLLTVPFLKLLGKETNKHKATIESERYGFDESTILEMMSDHGFRAYSYQPFQRTLLDLYGNNMASGNTLFIRNTPMWRRDSVLESSLLLTVALFEAVCKLALIDDPAVCMPHCLQRLLADDTPIGATPPRWRFWRFSMFCCLVVFATIGVCQFEVYHGRYSV